MPYMLKKTRLDFPSFLVLLVQSLMTSHFHFRSFYLWRNLWWDPIKNKMESQTWIPKKISYRKWRLVERDIQKFQVDENWYQGIWCITNFPKHCFDLSTICYWLATNKQLDTVRKTMYFESKITKRNDFQV